MLHLISSREKGQVHGRYFKCLQASRQVLKFELSRSKEVEQIFSSGVNSLDLDSQENRYLVSATSNGCIGIFDTENTYGQNNFTSKCIARIERNHEDAHKFSIETVQWYPHDTGMFITSSVDAKMKVWDTNILKVAEEFHLPGHICSHQMSRSAKKHSLVAAACENSRVNLCDLRSGSSTHILKGHEKGVLSVAWSPRCDYVLASGSKDNRLLLWDVRRSVGCLASLDLHNGKKHSNFQSSITAHNGHVNGLRFTADGLHLISLGTDCRLRLWNVLTCKNTLVHYKRVLNFTSRKIEFDVTHGLSPELVFVPNRENISVMEIFTGNDVGSLNGHFGNVSACILNTDEQELYSGGMDTHVLVWHPKKRAVEDATEEHQEMKKEAQSRMLHPAHRDTWSSDED